MNIYLKESHMSDIKVFEYQVFQDARGGFSEIWKKDIFEKLELPDFIQENMSVSKKGVIRGLHWQVEPFSQGKLIRCARGEILDVVVDIRKQSDTYGNVFSIILNQSDNRLLWVPSGFAHGFQALVDDTEIIYKVDKAWDKSSERSLNPLDPKLNIDWPIKEILLSEKDSVAPNLDS